MTTRALLLFAALLLFLGVPTSAQTITQVSATVTDPSGVPYSGATLTVLFNNPGGKSPTLTPCTGPPAQVGCPLPALGTVVTNVAGAFTIPLYANASILPAASTYTFQLAEPGNPTPMGTGPQTCTLANQTIAGSSQVLTFTGCPALSNVSGGASSTSNVLQGLNAKGFGAAGNTQYTLGTLTSGQPDITTTASVFSVSDIGKRANCNQPGSGGFFPAGSVILTFVNATHVKLNNNSSGNATTPCEWGTNDNSAILSLNTAVNANVKGVSAQPLFYQGIPTGPAVGYFPTGMYMVDSSTSGLLTLNLSTQSGISFVGDGPGESWLISSDTPAVPTGAGFFVECASGAGLMKIKDLSFNGFWLNGSGGTSNLNLNCSHYTENIQTANAAQSGFVTSATFSYNLNLVASTNSGGGISCNSCNDEFHYGGSSNNQNSFNLAINNTLASNQGPGSRFVNFFIDECGAAPACTQLINAQDVWSQGSVFNGTPNGAAISCDATSYLHMDGGMTAVFGTDTPNSGLLLSNGCRVQATDVRFVGSGTGKAINNTGNSLGGFFDLGGNRVQMLVLASSGSETTSTATFTTTTNPVANCPVGGTVDVQGVTPAGYNGTNMPITANGASSLSYTANASGLGAASGGQLFCNLSPGNSVGYSGVAPIFPLSVNAVTQLGGQQVTAGTAPTFAVTGFGTGPTIVIQTGSTDIAGTVTVTAGTTPGSSGTFTLTFSRALGTNPPVCTFTLANGTGTWSSLAQEPIVQTPTTVSVIANWADNSIALTAGSTYGFNWSCYGK